MNKHLKYLQCKQGTKKLGSLLERKGDLATSFGELSLVLRPFQCRLILHILEMNRFVFFTLNNVTILICEVKSTIHLLLLHDFCMNKSSLSGVYLQI